MRLSTLFLTLALPVGCATSASSPSAPRVVASASPTQPSEYTRSQGPLLEDWMTDLSRDHPLVGKILHVGSARLVDPNQLREAVVDAGWVLLGERHDHPDHHRLQERILRWMVDAGRKPSVTFEMLDVKDQPVVDAFLAAHPKQAHGLGHAVAWEDRGWPSWAMYSPIVQTALDAALPIVAGNLTREEVMRIAMGGQDAARDLHLSIPELPEPQVDAMMTELFEAHCRHVPRDHMRSMALAQIARDAMLARSMVQADRGGGGVLIAGNGHVRNDRGVPYHLRLASVRGTIVAVGMQEVQPDLLQPQDYAEPDGALPFDFIVFTPRLTDEDPCDRFKSRRG